MNVIISLLLITMFLLSGCKALEIATLKTADEVIETEIKEIEQEK
jgi:PBP1b-binding outer membrane lipoprotein LpoB